MSGYVYVCEDEENREAGVELPVEEDGNLLVSVLQSQFERASGLKYRWENQVCVYVFVRMYICTVEHPVLLCMYYICIAHTAL